MTMTMYIFKEDRHFQVITVMYRRRLMCYINNAYKCDDRLNGKVCVSISVPSTAGNWLHIYGTPREKYTTTKCKQVRPRSTVVSPTWRLSHTIYMYMYHPLLKSSNIKSCAF